MGTPAMRAQTSALEMKAPKQPFEASSLLKWLAQFRTENRSTLFLELL